MKAAAPPPPTSKEEEMGTNENVLWKHSVILYQLDASKKWAVILKEDFATLSCVDTGRNASKERYQLQYGNGKDKVIRPHCRRVEIIGLAVNFLDSRSPVWLVDHHSI